ncbi:MAG: alpha-L-rhamnosidase [Clostridiales bacterium]|nr:alpha-L-rhamnosidase [Clostridiales bacterium]
MLKIINLKIEGLSENAVTDVRSPRISFALESDKPCVNLESATVHLNDWVGVSDDNACIKYKGQTLKPFTEYTLKVIAKADNGESAEGSLTFYTGRMGTPWSAKWITDKKYKFRGKKVSPRVMTFRKLFGSDKPIKSAVLYSTALGIYEATLNGQKIGEDFFAPGFTQYKKHLQYQRYDLTDLIKKDNDLRFYLAGGWAVGKFTMCLRNRVFAKRQALLAEIHIVYEDGETEKIVTDESWDVTMDSPFLLADFYDGETFDARLTDKDLTFTHAAVEKVKLNPEYSVTYGTLCQKHETFIPTIVSESDDEIIYDFGQNHAGVIEIEVTGESGQKIVVRHAEVLMDGKLFTKPLRSAKCTATYICKGEGVEKYSPKFTYMGFRYTAVSGVKKENIVIRSRAVYSGMSEVGSFYCSNQNLNKLQSNIKWSSKSNFVDIPIDCCQRDERMGWTGDIALFSRTAAFNFDTRRFFDKWLKDLRVEQKKTGGIPMTVPHVVFPSNLESVFTMAVDHWGDSCILVPWAEYLARGDVSVLQDNYSTMKRYIKACKFWAGLLSLGYHRRIWSFGHHYGDWVAPGIGLMAWMGRGKWTATACFKNSCTILSQIADILGKREDREYYQKLSKEIAYAYRRKFTRMDGKLKKEFQTGYVLPLHYGVFEGQERLNAAKNLKKLVEDNGYNITTGFPGTPYILFALCDNGYEEDAYKMLLNESCPSWLHQVKAGGTTIWERWDALRSDGTSNTGADDGTHGMISFNHYANGAVGDFMYRRILGVEALTGGYKQFKISPVLGGGITFAKGHVDCPYGRIEADWRIEDGKFSIDVAVPVSTTCLLKLPNGQETSLPSGKYNFSYDL